MFEAVEHNISEVVDADPASEAEDSNEMTGDRGRDAADIVPERNIEEEVEVEISIVDDSTSQIVDDSEAAVESKLKSKVEEAARLSVSAKAVV